MSNATDKEIVYVLGLVSPRSTPKTQWLIVQAMRQQCDSDLVRVEIESGLEIVINLPRIRESLARRRETRRV